MTTSDAEIEAGPAEHVHLVLARDPALVRTARVVAVSLARRAGLHEDAVDEVRLGVGEVCAVLLGGESTPADPADRITLAIATTGAGLRVTVSGTLPDTSGELAALGLDPWALAHGITERVSLAEDDGVTTVTLDWSA